MLVLTVSNSFVGEFLWIKDAEAARSVSWAKSNEISVWKYYT